MTPTAFVAKWQDNLLTERAGAQAFFLDLCDVLGVEKPNDPENYCFERGATRTGAGHGWADVWKRNCFAWENKGPEGDLAKALKQLMTYALALDNPPLLVVCDRGIIEIHTHFTGTPSEVHTIKLVDIGLPENLQKLRWVFTEPEQFKPRLTVRDITAAAAGRFAEIAQVLTSRGHDPQEVAHFLIQCLFCMFAEDVGLLPQRLFGRVVEKSCGSADKLATRLGELFTSMRTGGEFLMEDIQWFNGGLFETVTPLKLETKDVAALLDAARMDWSHIEPSIFGTLFERGLDPAMRSQLGANFTDPETIRKLIAPVIVRPLSNEWREAKADIATAMAKFHAGGKGSQISLREAQARFHGYIERLKHYRVLDPACGSGNFLYLALRALKDLEHRANLDAEALGLQRQLSIDTGPESVLGIEINPYAAELARVTVWIGEIQWMLTHGYDIRRKPILSPLDHVQCRDAVLNDDGSEPEWPPADAIVGNPPFLGNKKLLGQLGADYVAALRRCYSGRIPAGVDLVTYWFEKARAQIAEGKAKLAGLVATQAIRGGSSRKVLDRITSSARIFEAWSDEPWVNEGAAVRVSLICFGQMPTQSLDGRTVRDIFPNLTAREVGAEYVASDLTKAAPLDENSGICFQGPVLVGPFEVPGNLARHWLLQPNPHGRPNSDVLRPLTNGKDITSRSRELWVIDFADRTESESSLYELPFDYVRVNVKPLRDANRDPSRRARWWLHGRVGTDWRAAVINHPRYIATSQVSKHRVFVWRHQRVWPHQTVICIARSDDVTFGVVSSRFHELWSLQLGTALEDRPRYTPTTTFETFPFPIGLAPRDTGRSPPHGPHVDAIATAARHLDEQRETWLNPTEWTDRVPEIVPGYPDRIIVKHQFQDDLRKRTLTNLYNVRPTWLDNAHKALDVAVARAYGWADYTPETSDDELLSRMLILNAKIRDRCT